ncbi:hypothetical protein OH77DRAFT_822503 [Trametes cingulata]|nr:hypothetical protein OH77DRAFT_822503 [Trametes cingulata]
MTMSTSPAAYEKPLQRCPICHPLHPTRLARFVLLGVVSVAPEPDRSFQPLVYGSRMPRLVVRTTDNADSASSTATSNSDSHHTPTLNAAIPAFIAVAVFVLCTVVAMRAIRVLRGQGVTPVYRKSDEDEKPQMFEIHLGEPPEPARTAGGWEQVMPVSLEYLPPYEAPSHPSSSRASSSRAASSRASSVGPPTPPSLPARPSRPSSRERGLSSSSWSVFSSKSAATASSQDDPSRSMRVAVLIAMPSPPPPPGGGDRRSSWGSGAPTSPPPAYLGLAEV